MKRNRSKARREEKEARRQAGFCPPAWGFVSGCHHCGSEVGAEGILTGTLGGGAPMLLCRPCGRRLMAEVGV